MAVYLSPIFGAAAQLFNDQGVVLALGTINTYAAGTTTPLATYTDNTGSTPNNVSIPLNSAGRPSAEIWLTGGQAYKFIVKDANGNTVGIAYDNISGINDPGTSSGGSTAVWVTPPASTPTYLSATTFSVPGDLRTTFPVGTRVKTTNTAGTVYATVTAVSFSSFTTVTVNPDSGTLDSGLSLVQVSINSVVGQNVSAAAASYLSSLTYPAGSVGLAMQGFGTSISSINTSITNMLGSTKAPTTGGTSTAYTLLPTVLPLSYVTGQTWLLEAHTSSGASPTLNINSLGAKNLKQYTSAGTKVNAALISGAIYLVGYDGTDLIVMNPTTSSSGKLLRITKFAASGTWTKQADSSFVVVELVGGGGGAGVSTGGAGGGFARALVTSPGATETVTVGAGGSGGSASGGNSGTLSSFGAWASASGGSGTGTSPGVGTVGDVLLNGNASPGGAGGGSVWGGAAGLNGSTTGLSAPANSGGGGGIGSVTGGNGGTGYVVVYEYS